MTIDTFASSAFAVFLLALHKLEPRAEVLDVDLVSSFFSCTVSFPKKIGPEYKEFLLESIRAISRQDLPFRAFSMMSSVFEGFVEKEKMVLDPSLRSHLSEDSDRDSALLNIVQIGSRFCVEQYPGSSYFERTSSVKWVDLFLFEIEQNLWVVRGVSSSSAKTTARMIRLLEQEMKPLVSNKALVLTRSREADSLGSIQKSFLLSQALQDIDNCFIASKASKCQLPPLDEDVVLDLKSPLLWMTALRKLWRDLCREEKTLTGKMASLVPTRVHSFPSRLTPVASLHMASAFSLYQKKGLQDDFLSICAFLADLYPILTFHIILSSKMSGRKREILAQKILKMMAHVVSEMQNKTEICQEITAESHLQSDEVCIILGTKLLDGFGGDLYRGALLFSIEDSVNMDWENGPFQCTDLHCVPFFSYEQENRLRDTSVIIAV